MDGLLQPGRPELREAIGDPQRGRCREAVVRLDHQVDVGADRVAHRADDVDREVLVAAVLDAPRGPEGVELHRGVAGGGDLAGLGGDGLRLALRPVPAVGVGADAVADPPAEQGVDREPGGLADDVPARDLDGRDGRHVDLAAVGVDVADHPLEQRLDVVRVGPEVLVGQLLDRRGDGRREPIDRAFPIAVQAVVGLDTDEQPVLPGVADDAGLDRRDAHPRSVAPWHDGDMQTLTAEVVADGRWELGEGPIWDADDRGAGVRGHPGAPGAPLPPERSAG